MNTIDISYCKATVVLSGQKTKRGYVFSASREMYPYLTSELHKSINFGDVVETEYSLYVDLKPSERPNPITIRGYSPEMPYVYCLRHSRSRGRARVSDFVQSLGATHVEVKDATPL